MENLDLVEILKDAPEGTKLYSTINGDVILYEVHDDGREYPISIVVKENDIDKEHFTKEGKYYSQYPGECILFPSKDNRDWSTFKYKRSKSKPKDDWKGFHPSESDNVNNSDEQDNVNHPAHYTSHPSGIECIEITRHYCFSIGNAIKYLWRAGLKKDASLEDKQKEIEDLEKSIWYINDRIKQLKES